jgi:hypothetical protein
MAVLVEKLAPSLNYRLTLFTSYSLSFYEDAEGFAGEIRAVNITEK